MAFGLLMFWIMFRGIRKLGLEGWLLFPPLVLAWSDWLAGQPPSSTPQTIYSLRLIPEPAADYRISFGSGTVFAPGAALGTFRLAQRQMTLEMKQAQEVQQVLIPEAVPQIPGFSIQSVYQPAGQVGGDFFQILPAKQGGVLVCIGDVSGKGMPAAMTVSLLVGTLRTLAHYSQSPGEILSAMNQRMLGRSRGGFTTCLVLLAAADGTVTVAKAGHISPYLNGHELPLENGLPLGLVAKSSYPNPLFTRKKTSRLRLSPTAW